MTDTPHLEWHYARRAVPGYAELTAAHEAVNWALAGAEIEPDIAVAAAAVQTAFDRWLAAFGAWHPLASPQMPV